MNGILSFYVDKKTAKLIDKIVDERKWSKSKVIREAICFFDEFGLDRDTIEKIERLSRSMRLKKAAVVALGIQILEEVDEKFRRW